MGKLSTRNVKPSAPTKSHASQKEEKGSQASSQSRDYFNCDVQTFEDSLAYAKKMIVVAISNIAYLRALWPEEFFVDRYFEKIQLKIIESRAHQQAHVLTKWILGVFHALERKYLRQFTLSIFMDPSKLDDVLETYEFNVAYNERVSLEITTRDERKQKIRANSLRFIRQLIYASQMLENLPESCYMNLRLFYYDDVTPGDYEPPGFKPFHYTEFNFEDGRVQLPVGKLHSLWHMLEFNVNASRSLVRDYDEFEKAGESVMTTKTLATTTSLLDDKDENDESIEESRTYSRLNLKNARRLISSSESADESQQTDVDVSMLELKTTTDITTSGYDSVVGGPNDAADNANASNTTPRVDALASRVESLTFGSSKLRDNDDDDENQNQNNQTELKDNSREKDITRDMTDIVDCECGMTDTSDMVMVRCSKCLTQQHAVCYRIWLEDEQDRDDWSRKYKHYCRPCYTQIKGLNKPRQVDRAIYVAASDLEIQQLCLVRRLVRWIWQLGEGVNFTPRMIVDTFGIDRKRVADMLASIRETFKVNLELPKKKGLYMAEQAKLNKIINECFSQPMSPKNRDSTRISLDDTSLNNSLTNESSLAENEPTSSDKLLNSPKKKQLEGSKSTRVTKSTKVSLSTATILKRRKS